MPEISEIGLLAVKVHSSASDPVPTSLANALSVIRDTVTYDVLSTPVDREDLDGGGEAVAGYPSALPMATLRFRTWVRGNRTDGSADDISAGSISQAIELDPLFRACDYAATYTAETTGGARDGYVTYQRTLPTDGGTKVAFYFWTQQKLHKILLCKGTAELVCEVGKMPYIEWTFSGTYVAPVDATFPTDAVFEDTKPPLVVGASTLTIGSYTPVMTRFGLNLNNTVTRRLDMTATDGIKDFAIVRSQPTGGLDPESVTEATNPFWANWKANEVKTITVLVGSQTGNKFQVTAVTQTISLKQAVREGIRTFDKNFKVVRATPNGTQNNALQFKFF
jgi:hypothetical protein